MLCWKILGLGQMRNKENEMDTYNCNLHYFMYLHIKAFIYEKSIGGVHQFVYHTNCQDHIDMQQINKNQRWTILKDCTLVFDT